MLVAHRKALAWIVAACLLLGSIAWGWWSGLLRAAPPTAAGSYPGRNVVLITIDTLRADHLPIHGYTKVKTPVIDALASESVVFQSAISHVPLTLPSHTSMLTGLLPPRHGIPDNGGFVVDPKLTTLPALLAAQGYATGAFVSSFVLDSRWQLNKGFGTYFDNFYVPEFNEGNPGLLQRKGGDTEVEAERWLDAHTSGPFFLWLHLYDPHQPYDPPEPYRSEYAGHLYDGEIAYADSVVGRLLDKLGSLGLTDRTIVVLTSDHGESLGEHGELTHGLLVYEATLHVPLLMRLPRGKHRSVGAAVGHVDIAPTLLEWLGLPVPSAMQGRSLIPLIEGREDGDRAVYSESRYAEFHYGWNALTALTTARYEFIQAVKPELYDRRSDREEKRSLIGDEGTIAADLSERLKGVLAQSAVGAAAPEQTEVDAETEDRLRALGYLGSGPAGAHASRGIDPKDVVHLHNAMNDASNALLEHRDAEVLRILEPILREDPDMTEAHYAAGVAEVRLHRYDEAVAAFRRVVEAQPEHRKALYNLATTCQGLKRYAEAEGYYKRLLALDPRHIQALVHLANLHREQGRDQEARPRFLEAAALYDALLEKSPAAERRADLHARAAELYFRAHEPVRAEQYLKAAIAEAPTKPALHYNLALLYESLKSSEAAMDAYRGEIAVAPRNQKAYRGLAALLRDTGHPSEAEQALQTAIQVAPEDAESYYRLAELYLLGNEKLDLAERLAAKAVALAPGFVEARQLLGRIQAHAPPR